MTHGRFYQGMRVILVLAAGIWFASGSVKFALAATPSFSFSPQNIIVKKYDQFEVEVMINTAGYDVGGAGVKIVYDPNRLAVMKIDPGEIFADYPALIFDNESGRLTISAVSSINNFYNGKGVLATILFYAKESGPAQLNYIFQPKSTTDSNIAVTFGNGDVLETVQNLEVNVGEPDNLQGGTEVPINAVDSAPKATILETLKDWINGLFNWFNLPAPFAGGSSRAGRTAINFDPNQPLTRQTPITDPDQSQPRKSDRAGWSWLSLPEVYLPLISLILIALGLTIWWKKGRR